MLIAHRWFYYLPKFCPWSFSYTDWFFGCVAH